MRWVGAQAWVQERRAGGCPACLQRVRSILCLLRLPQGFNAPSLLSWKDAKVGGAGWARAALPPPPVAHLTCTHPWPLPQAAKFVPLAGEAPPFSTTPLHPTRELLHRARFWEGRAPDVVVGYDSEEDEEDEEGEPVLL